MANVYLKIEIKQRELISRILIAMHCAIKKNTVYLGNLQDYLFKDKLCPGLFMDKSISRTASKISKLKKIRENGHIITSMDEEMGVSHENYHSFAKLRFSNETLQLTSAIFCWGDFDFKFLRKKYNKYKKIFFKTGSPRVDICNILKKFDQRKRLNKLPKKKYIVVASNFGTIVSKKPLWKVLSDRKHYYKKKKVDNNVENESFRFGRDIWKTLILREYLDFIEKLSLSFKNKFILIRPHPSEVKKSWEAILNKNLKNVGVMNDYSSSEVLNFAELMIHSGCTTGLEAKLLGTPVISFNPLKDRTYERKFFTKCGKEINNSKKIISFIKKNNYRKISKNQSFEKELDYKFFMNKSISSSARISDVIQSLIRSKNLNNYKNSFRNWYTLNIIEIKFFIKKIFFMNSKEKYYQHKFSDIAAHEVEEMIKILKKTNKNFSNIKFKIFGDRLLKIWSD